MNVERSSYPRVSHQGANLKIIPALKGVEVLEAQEYLVLQVMQCKHVDHRARRFDGALNGPK